VQSGWLRASPRKLDPTMTTATPPWHTNAQAVASPLPAGKFVPVRVELMPFATVFRAGDRIRITVEAPGGNRPFWTFDSIPANGVVTNDIAHSIGHASKVVLPVIPGIVAPTPLPPCPSLRGQPCRTAYGNSTPTDVKAKAVAPGDARVKWTAPGTARPGDTIISYTVHESPDGATAIAAADAHSVKVKNLSGGQHFFSVEADYAGGTTSGLSTPSHTINVADGAGARYRHAGRVDF
jgi:hypothetical protein